nr:MAG TPA: hypothetical protein [Caudoviricetes sp.]
MYVLVLYGCILTYVHCTSILFRKIFLQIKK